ncbi:RNA polymerase subunit sigma-70 [Streptomyces sp. NBC_01498]|uniref:RNA polymerase subunit sigma-70 n=1 Tax=Streptomyces sp. NBC_01498 TaxID=2975870 RepID=UPI002E7AE535|nr:RNA polymerase subunit sigma-70 [Streptomyces sp. NBC_01498]WTL26654.1 RNA polymerase subunit sigma-70 [Streptomyces sp. NBC_01498]
MNAPDTGAGGRGGPLALARTGDRPAFDRLVGPYRRELHLHAYRMLGSFHDADDVVQETLLRAWRALDRFEERRGTADDPVRAWLYRIATNRCLTLLETRARRELPTGFGHDERPPDDIAWLEPYPDALLDADPGTAALRRESVELAFVVALQRLSPMQRAAVVLRDVLDFPAREAADVLDTTVPSVNSALQRARRALAAGRRPGDSRTQRQELGALPPGELRALARRYARAWDRGDVDAIVAMLGDDVRYSMPPGATWYEGPDAVREFLVRYPLTLRWRFVPTRSNGQLAFGAYLLDEGSGRFRPVGVDVLTLRSGRVSAVTAFLTADLTPWGLPEEPPEGELEGESAGEPAGEPDAGPGEGPGAE